MAKNCIFLENHGNHANNKIFFGDQWFLTKSVQKSHCLPDWVRGDVSILDVEGALNAAEYNGTRPYMSGPREKLLIAPQNLPSGDRRSDELPCPHPPTLSFLESLSSDIFSTELIQCVFN